MLRVTDLDRSIQYYTEALGMKLLRKRDNPEGKYTLAFMAYGPENENTVIELTYNWCAIHSLCMLVISMSPCGSISSVQHLQKRHVHAMHRGHGLWISLGFVDRGVFHFRS